CHASSIALAMGSGFPGDNLSYARQVFDQIPKCKTQFLRTSLIRNHVLHAHFRQSILLYALE
ncbi:hypothetical protein, partial [Serratia marcescens]|uniref:hypothetical protein n=1 Tax=Serratia marcescens TaxID=615 RepID=UPI001952C752